MLDADAYGFIERCRGHKSAKDLLSDLLLSVEPLGFDHLILSGVPVGGQKLAPMVELMGWPAGWFERYIEAEYAGVDAVCIFSAKTLKPFFWQDVPAKWSNTRENADVSGDAAAFGIRSGFAVPMLSYDHWQSVVSFASGARRCDLSGRQQAQIITMAVFAGMAIQALASDDIDDSALTEREKEVLLWAAGGKSAWETSEILQISEKTVIWYLDSIRRKLGVARTVQAVVEAVRRRMIHP